jgi:branched-chain amino acid transport system permease protein
VGPRLKAPHNRWPAVEYLIYSIAWGSALALMAGGLALYYSVSKVANFAHGEYASVGLLAYLLAVALAHGLGRCRGLNIVDFNSITGGNLWALAVAFIAGAGVAAASFVLVFWPLIRRGARPLQLMVVSIGLMFLLRFLLYITASFYGWLTLPKPDATKYTVLGVGVDLAEITSIVLAVAATVGIALFTSKTMIGISMRAVADNPSLAEATGISSFKVQLVAWSIGGGLAAVGGVLMFALTGPPGERPIVELGWMNLLPVFAALVIGGLGSFYGALAASIILGLAYNEVAALLTMWGLNSSLALLVPFGLTIAFLLFLPQGLAGINWYRLLRISRLRVG